MRDERNRDPGPDLVHKGARGRFLYPLGSIFVPQRVHFSTPDLRGPSLAGSRELAAEQTVYDGSYTLLNVQFFLLATPERSLSKRLGKVRGGL